jgi:hypothetical protein
MAMLAVAGLRYRRNRCRQRDSADDQSEMFHKVLSFAGRSLPVRR